MSIAGMTFCLVILGNYYLLCLHDMIQDNEIQEDIDLIHEIEEHYHKK